MEQIKYLKVGQQPKIDIDCAGWLVSSYKDLWGALEIQKRHNMDVVLCC